MENRKNEFCGEEKKHFEEINKTLIDVYRKIVPYAYFNPMIIFKIMKLTVFYGRIVRKENALYDYIYETIKPYALAFQTNGNNGFNVIIGSGLLRLNPAFVIIEINVNEIHIQAYAKEGLIKQHTAKKAVLMMIELIASDNDDIYLDGGFFI